MGCCCGKANKDEEDMVEMSTTTNVAVTLKAGAKGEGVQVTPDGGSYTVTGKGTALGSCALDCDVGMWEVVVGKGGGRGVRVGIKRWHSKKPSPLSGQLGEDGTESWAFPTFANGGKDLEEGDVVSVFWDQTDLPMLSFAVNGVPFPEASVSRIRPSSDIYPACSVSGEEGGSECRFVFDGQYFKYPPAGSKFKMVICATSLI